MIEEVLPTLYRDLLTQLVSQGVDHERVTLALPTEGETKPKWKSLLGPLYRTHLINSNIFWTQAGLGRWCKISEVYFLKEDVEGDEDSEAQEAVRNLLIRGNVQIVQIPSELVRTINQHFAGRIKSLNPGSMREFLRKNSFLLKDLNREKKLLILSYLLSDSCYSDLKDVQLLPLDNGAFEAISSLRPSIFIEADGHPKSLLMPGFQGRFIHPGTNTAKLFCYIGMAINYYYILMDDLRRPMSLHLYWFSFNFPNRIPKSSHK